jgi:hypothetical protein
MKNLTFLLASSALFAASSAVAHTPPEQAGAMPDTAAEASTAADAQDAMATADAPTTASDAAFTDAQIESFAAAALKIQALEGNASVTQEQLLAIVTETGLEPATYVAIAQGMKDDEALAQRVQVAATALQNQTTG